jgi:hypothetical protein
MSLISKSRGVPFTKVGGLSITTKLGEIIEIGDDIHVQVVAKDRGRVRINISAPRDLVIKRTKPDDEP